MQLISTQQWGHHQAKNTNWRNEMYMEVPTTTVTAAVTTTTNTTTTNN
jgi:hypothetical protein